jgi:Tfp pilus assembly PilM family ATPase
MLGQAGLTVEVLDFGISSLIRLHSYPHATLNNPIILCNIGWTHSLLSVVSTESILLQRNVPWGLQMLFRNLQANLELSNDKDKAKVLLKKYGLFYEDCLECSIDDPSTNEEMRSDDSRGMYRAIYQIINPQIEQLVHEFHNIIGYARSEEHDVVFEGIYIYGEGNFIRHLDGYLEKRLNLQARLMNPLTKVALVDEEILPDISEGAPFGLALGLAMRKVSWL